MSTQSDGNRHETPVAKTITEAKKPPRTRNRDITRRLASWHMLINVASNDQTILALMDRSGFGPERITQEGAALLAQVRQRMQEQTVAAGDQLSAKDERDRSCKEVYSQYVRHKALARVALRGDRGALDKLGLQDRTKTYTTGKLEQARQFYSLALDNAMIQMRLAEVGLTHDKLEGSLGLIAQVDHCLMLQASTRNEAKEATRRRDEAIKRMEAWAAEFRTVARFALRDQPQLLGKLGL